MEETFKDTNSEMFKVVDDISRDILATLILTRKSSKEEDTAAPADKQSPSIPPEISSQFLAVMRHSLSGA